MAVGPQRKQPKPEGRFQEGTDYGTGRRTVFHEIDVPGRQSHEPHSIRAQASESGKNQWQVKVTHGPHETKDESGSYYKHVGSFSHEGPVGSLRSALKRSTSAEWKNLRA